jgi:hypothetical protein
MAQLKLKTGWSSNVLNIKVKIGGVVLTDLTGYTCRYHIEDANANIVQTVLPITSVVGVFPFKITPTQSTALTKGFYKACFVIENSASEFKQGGEISIEIDDGCLV